METGSGRNTRGKGDEADQGRKMQPGPGAGEREPETIDYSVRVHDSVHSSNDHGNSDR
jgi:hypothetical protein